MILEFTKYVTAIPRATDFVEAEILNIPKCREKRDAILANAMGKPSESCERWVTKDNWIRRLLRTWTSATVCTGRRWNLR